MVQVQETAVPETNLKTRLKGAREKFPARFSNQGEESIDFIS